MSLEPTPVSPLVGPLVPLTDFHSVGVSGPSHLDWCKIYQVQCTDSERSDNFWYLCTPHWQWATADIFPERFKCNFFNRIAMQDWISKYWHQMMIGPQCKFAEACFKCFKRLKISGILSMTLHTSQHTSRSWYVQNYVFSFDTNLIILKPIDSVLTLWKSENSQLWFVAHRRPLELLSSTFRSREREGGCH